MKRFLTLCALLAVALLPGCGGGSGTAPNPLLGVWRLRAMASGGLQVNCPGSLLVAGEPLTCGENIVYRYRDDGSYSGTGGDVGRWTLAGSELTQTRDDGAALRSTVTFTNGEMRQDTRTQSGRPIRFTFEKE